MFHVYVSLVQKNKQSSVTLSQISSNDFEFGQKGGVNRSGSPELQHYFVLAFRVVNVCFNVRLFV